ncbi:MAG TPA: AMP-binding protein [Thermodesulfovibrionales bacterium]|nr:AMP-binding protein [Thermodesulfovibrionales bacterium]
MTNNTIISLFLNAAGRYPDNTAFNYFAQSWRTITYGEFLGKTRGIASHLIQEGVRKGDRIAIILENRHEWCASYLGVLIAGGIAVPMDAQLGSNEVKNLLNDSGAALVVHSDRTETNVKSQIRGINVDSTEFQEICRTPFRGHYPNLTEEDLASIVYTSGTTGTPKGVMLTHKNFCSDSEALISAGIVTHEDNVLSILPLHHTYAFMCTFLVPLFLGATITYPLGMKGPELISTMKERGVTVLVAVPQLLELIRNGIMKKFREMPSPVSLPLLLLLRISGGLRKSTDLNMGRVIFASAQRAFGERFRFFASGGARLDPMVKDDLEALGFTALEGYGLTETSPVVTFNPVEKRKSGSAGRPLPGAEIKILNPSGTGEGEIAIRGPMVMKGYYKHPEATAQVIRDGWFLSGDLGYLDNEGYLFITGRAKEVIVLSSGKNVYPEEVEKAYQEIPLVKEICVTGIEKEGIVESLHGVIVPNLDHARKERIGNISDSLKWAMNKVALKLPPYMRLKGFTLSSEPLPRTPLGKLRRYMVRDIISKARGGRREAKGEDSLLLRDETGRVVEGCITPLLREAMPVHLSDNLELDLGLDSLQRIELVVALEKAFSFKLPETFASEVQTVGELVERIKEFKTRGISGAEKPLWEDIFAAEIPEEERKKIGLYQGRVEWAFSAVCIKLIKFFLRVFFRLEARGIENIPAFPFIIAPNHCSNMDGFVVGLSIPLAVFKSLYFQGYQTYFQGWLPSLFARLAHVIPIDPETFLSKALQLSSYVLKKNRALCIFPEGGRSIDGSLLEFKKGIGILAMEHNIPVVPVLIEGTFEALPRGALWPKFVKITLTIGRPLYAAKVDFSKKPEGIDEYQFFANEVRERVKGLKEFPADQ